MLRPLSLIKLPVFLLVYLSVNMAFAQVYTSSISAATGGTGRATVEAGEVPGEGVVGVTRVVRVPARGQGVVQGAARLRGRVHDRGETRVIATVRGTRATAGRAAARGERGGHSHHAARECEYVALSHFFG